MLRMTKPEKNIPEKIAALIEVNLQWLQQAAVLVARLDDRTYAQSPAALPRHKAGAHLRHILDFYDAFCQGLDPQGTSGYIDYSARRRDPSTANNRQVALLRLRSLSNFFETRRTTMSDASVFVRVEDADLGGHQDCWMTSSLARELQMLSSHTVHHFALIAVTLQAHGVELDSNFGMAPSTLRFEARQVA